MKGTLDPRLQEAGIIRIGVSLAMRFYVYYKYSRGTPYTAGVRRL